MRISTAAWYGGQTANMARLQAETARLQENIATGTRLRAASDDPAASARADRLAAREANVDLWAKNADTAANRLTTSSEALTNMSSDLVRIHELTLSAANETLSPADRQVIAAEIEQLVGGLLTLANTKDADGRYVFAGAASDSPAFAEVGGVITYQGSGEPPRAPIAAERAVSVGDGGDGIFDVGGGRSIFTAAEDLLATLRAVPAGAEETDAQRTARRAGLDSALRDFEAAETSVGEANATQGARLAQIETASERLAIDRLDAVSARSAIEDTDITRAIVDLERKTTLLQAAQAGFTRISSLSLFQRL
ncbi:MAG: flagellar hook-associated protein FlgL [Pacificimonas sp.]